MNGFYAWLLRKGIIETNFIKGIDKPKLEYSLPRRLSDEDSEKVLLAARSMRYAYHYERKRNYAIIATMLMTGLRRSEVANLMLADANLSTSTISVIHGKGGKDRLIPICSRLSSIIKDYLTDRERLHKKSEFLFTAVQKDEQIGIRCLNNLIARLRDKTGLNFSAHTLRHSFATMMLEGGVDIYTLSKMMGHNKITTTTIYLACSTKMMMSSIEKHPLN